MKRKEFLITIGAATLTGPAALNNVLAQTRSTTWEIDHDECTGCGMCVEESEDHFAMNEEDKAIFTEDCCLQVSGEGTIANGGTEHYSLIREIADKCKVEAIEEFG